MARNIREVYVQLVPDRFGPEQWLVVRPSFYRDGRLRSLRVLDRYDTIDDAERSARDFNA